MSAGRAPRSGASGWPAPTMLLKLSANLNDSSSNGFTPTNSPTSNLQTTTPSPVASGYQVMAPANNNELRFADTALLDLDSGNWTISAFLYPTTTAAFYPAWCTKGGYLTDDGSWKLFRDMVEVSVGGAFSQSVAELNWVQTTRPANSLPLNAWTRATVTRSGNTITSYAGSTVLGTVDASTFPSLSTANPFVVGGNLVADAENWTGNMCDFVYIKGTALNADQISYLQTNPYPA